MKYRVVLIESMEGVAASCHELPGCHSQGETRDEALDNIRIAIQEFLEMQQELEADDCKVYVEMVEV